MAYEYHAFQIRDGKITLYMRNLSNNSVWQCRFMAKGKCIRRSTKETQVEAAKNIAGDLYDEIKFKIKYNMPITLTTFEAIWKKWIVIMQNTTATWAPGGHRLRYATYVAGAHFLPYYGKRYVTAISTSTVTEYWAWRDLNASNGPPSAATLSMEAQLLKQFLKWALDSNHIDKMPKIKSPRKVDPKATRRQAFTDNQYALLKGYMMTWVNHPTKNIAERRRCFRNFVMVMFDSGMRVGEARNLKWQDVDITGHALLTVSGKTGTRTIVAQPECKVYLTDQRKISKFTKPDDYVFANSKGGVTKEFSFLFKSLLKAADVLIGADGAEYALYSMRHSYCTWRLLDGRVDWELLANNMGTSRGMIKKHYGHVTNPLFAKELTASTKPSKLRFKYEEIDTNHQT